MLKSLPQHQEKLAIEKCIRSFIIKSIHAIVQARNGIVYNTNCVSEVGARNNMMVYVEEDPEIGATIKQTLDTNFPIHVQDLLSLEILTHCSKEPENLMVVEVWQFRLDTYERFDGCVEISKLGTLSVPTSSAPCDHPSDKSTELAVDDFKHLRLFEKLGTLLKSIMVVTRLLPGYQLSRHNPSEYQMYYTLRRGLSDLSKLGSMPKSYQVGRIFSGLAVSKQPSVHGNETFPSPTASSDTVNSGLEIADGLDPVYFGATVYYRTNYGPNHQLVPDGEGINKVNLPNRKNRSNGTPQEIINENECRSCDFHSLHHQQQNKRCPKYMRNIDSPEKVQSRHVIGYEQSKLLCRVRPAFAINQRDEADSDELFDPASQLLGKKAADRVARCFTHIEDPEFPNEDINHTVDDEFEETDLDEEQKTDFGHQIKLDGRAEADGGRTHLHVLMKNLKTRCLNSLSSSSSSPSSPSHDRESASEDEDLLNNTTPLQLPFSTIGVSGARLTHLFAELRERANLDLFQVPCNNSGSGTIASSINNNNNNNNTAQFSLFDADALVDELERHERTLKEFDDFIGDFQNIELFGLVTSPMGLTDVRHHGEAGGAAAAALLNVHPISEM